MTLDRQDLKYKLEQEEGTFVIQYPPMKESWEVVKIIETIGAIRKMNIGVGSVDKTKPVGLMKAQFMRIEDTEKLKQLKPMTESYEEVVGKVENPQETRKEGTTGAPRQEKEIPKAGPSRQADSEKPGCGRTRIFCIMPKGEEVGHLYHEFKKFGTMIYSYITKSAKTGGRFGYVEYANPESARRAIRFGKTRYRPMYAEEQKRTQKGEEEKDQEVRHQPCGRMITKRVLQYHENICRPRKGMRYGNEGVPTTLRAEESTEKGTDKARNRNNENAKDERQAETITIPKHLRHLCDEDDIQMRIHEVTGREADPFNGLYWENAHFIEASEGGAPTYTINRPPSAEQIKSVIDYLEVTRKKEDPVRPKDDLIEWTDDEKQKLKEE